MKKDNTMILIACRLSEIMTFILKSELSHLISMKKQI